MAVLMNFAAHPTVLGAENMTFSADFVGYARNALERMIGGDVMAIFANGAQGTIAPRAFLGDDGWQRAENVGTILAAEVFKVTMMIKPQDSTDIKLVRTPLQLKIVPTSIFPPTMSYPPTYDSEINAISFDNRVAFVAIPGELGSILNFQVKERGKLLGFEKTFLLGLTTMRSATSSPRMSIVTRRMSRPSRCSVRPLEASSLMKRFSCLNNFVQSRRKNLSSNSPASSLARLERNRRRFSISPGVHAWVTYASRSDSPVHRALAWPSGNCPVRNSTSES